MSYKDHVKCALIKQAEEIYTKLEQSFGIKTPNPVTIIEEFILSQQNHIYRGLTKVYRYHVHIYNSLNEQITKENYCVFLNLEIKLFQRFYRLQNNDQSLNKEQLQKFFGLENKEQSSEEIIIKISI